MLLLYVICGDGVMEYICLYTRTIGEVEKDIYNIHNNSHIIYKNIYPQKQINGKIFKEPLLASGGNLGEIGEVYLFGGEGD